MSKTLKITSAGILITFILTYIATDFVFRKQLNSLKSNFAINEANITQKDQKIAELTCKIDNLEKFVNDAKINDLLSKQEQDAKLISEYENEKKFFQAKIQTLEKELNEAESNNYSKIESLQNQLNDFAAKHEEELKLYKGKIIQKEKEILKYKKNYVLFGKDEKFSYKNQDITSLVTKIKSLKLLCDTSYQDMEFKEISYKLLFKDLKNIFAKEQFIKRLKPVKIYTATPFLSSIKDKYISKNDDSNRLVLESNFNISTQMGEVLEFLEGVR
ncbi:ELKS/Rab6-interacting/CAST family protein [bacterium]|nr:ELKS/Rab6-interacting/CAST family protein [bacterium]